MSPIAFVAFAFLVGLVPLGVSASILECATGRPVGFSRPLVSGRAPFRTVLVTGLAGPFMLANDALRAYRGGVISVWTLMPMAAAALCWVLAVGLAMVASASVAVGQPIF